MVEAVEAEGEAAGPLSNREGQESKGQPSRDQDRRDPGKTAANR
jgi:hypothetical protein